MKALMCAFNTVNGATAEVPCGAGRSEPGRGSRIQPSMFEQSHPNVHFTSVRKRTFPSSDLSLILKHLGVMDRLIMGER